VLALINLMVISGCKSASTSEFAEQNCIAEHISGTFKYRNLSDLKRKLAQNHFSVIQLNETSMTLGTAVNLGSFLKENNIPLIISDNQICDDECAIPYLMAKLRYSQVQLGYPQYSIEEKNWLNTNGHTYFKKTYSPLEILDLVNDNFRDTPLQLSIKKQQRIDPKVYNNWSPEC